MRGGQGAEQLGEGQLGLVVEVVLAAEEDDLVLEQRGAHLGHGGGREVAAEPDALDDGADAAADLADADRRRRGHVLGVCVEVDRHDVSFLLLGVEDLNLSNIVT